MSDSQVELQDPRDTATLGTCSRCGHTISARCTDCGREFVCGAANSPCPVEGCIERVIDDKYGGADSDLQGGPEQPPNRSVRGGI